MRDGRRNTRKDRGKVDELKLTEKQKRFADYYVELGEQTDAYIKAGYKVKDRKVAKVNASRLLTNANLRKYIDECIEKKDGQRIAKQDEILEFLTSVMRGEVTEKVPIGLGYGEQKLIENNASIKDREKAAELLGKRYGTWVDNVNVETKVEIIDNIPKSDEG